MRTKGNTDRIPEMVFFVLFRCSTINNANVDTLLFNTHGIATSFSVPSWIMLKKAMGFTVLAVVTGFD